VSARPLPFSSGLRLDADLHLPDHAVGGAAATVGIPVAPHWHANVHAHLAAGAPNAIGVEHFELEKDIYNFERLLTTDTRLVVRDGAAHLSDRPGIGIELDEAAVERYEL
jgi:L-alanine-DL-glutamate epimerase-like enolase superfamily enzyme